MIRKYDTPYRPEPVQWTPPLTAQAMPELPIVFESPLESEPAVKPTSLVGPVEDYDTGPGNGRYDRTPGQE